MNHLIFADGSSLGNPGPSGWGAIIVIGERQVTEIGGSKKHSTNNEMELTALCESLREINHEPGDTTIYTDSSYVINGATKWVKGWITRNWVTSTNSPVLHREIWQELIKLIEQRRQLGELRFVHVPGHSGVQGNERADLIANEFSAGLTPELYNGSLADYAIEIMNIDIDTELHQARIRGKERAKLKAYSYVSRVGTKVMTHKSWAECEARVKGQKGALFQKVTSKEEEEKLVEKWKRI